jgi:hypothetical protein
MNGMACANTLFGGIVESRPFELTCPLPADADDGPWSNVEIIAA